MESRAVSVDGPLDLERTLRTLGVGSVDDDGSWWWATRMPGGPATIAVSRTAEGVAGDAWGPGADELLDRLPRLTAADDAYTVEATEQPMRDILGNTRGLRLGSTAEVHQAIITAVLGQVVTKTEGKRSLRSIVRSYGEEAPGPNRSLRLFPSPEALAGSSYEELHGHGIERKRAATVIEVSRRSKRLAEILTMGTDAAQRRLLAVRGVGPWTAGIVMGQAYGDRDALPIGDYHLPNMVSWALAGEPRGDDDRMVELLEPYRPYRRHALFAIKQAGIRAPKYGPRTAVRDHI